MSDDDVRRRDDRIAARTEQKLDDYIESSKVWCEQHDNSAKEWRIAVDDRLKILEAFNQRLDTPVRIISWSLIIVFGAVFTAVGAKLFHWLDR